MLLRLWPSGLTNIVAEWSGVKGCYRLASLFAHSFRADAEVDPKPVQAASPR
jgi:hypothetical protein